MHRTVLLLLSLFAITNTALCQIGALNGSVTHNGSGIESATITVYSSTDSTWIKSAVTDNKGVFSIPDLTYGKYLIIVGIIGYDEVKTIIELHEPVLQMQPTELKKETQQLNGITVTGKRPFIESKLGKIVVNIEGSATAAGANALDLMRRLPGMNVGQDGTITMNGKQGVQVMIDDKPTYLDGEELATYLRTITADEAAQIELISQPGAKYDAAGNSGIVNIKLKKVKKAGWNGNASLTYRQGIYAYNQGSLLLNVKKQKFNFNLNASSMAATGFAKWKETQKQTDAQTGVTVANSEIISNPVEQFSVTTLRLGCDYNANERNTFGISIRGAYHPNSMRGQINTDRQNIANGEPTTTNTTTREGFIREDATMNANWSHKFSADKTLDVNADALVYSDAPWQEIYSATLLPANQPVGAPLQLHSRQPNRINVYSLKADYTSPWKWNTSLEAGLKTSRVNTDNNSQFTLYDGNSWVIDTTRSNHFKYIEQINAAYLGLSKTCGAKWEAKIGLRAEQTLAQGNQYTTNTSFNRDYLSVFPTGFVSYKADSNNQLELNYGRRIDRPQYRSLNPFIYYSFQYSYTVGNPYLLPEYTNRIELRHNYKNRLITSLEYAQTNGVINDVLMVDSKTNVIYKTNRNLANNNNVSLGTMFIKDIRKWWSVNLSATLFYSSYSGLVNNSYRTNTGVGAFLNLNNRLELGKGWKSETNIYYHNSFVSSVIESVTEQIYIETGVSKKIGKKLDLKLMLNDPFAWYKMGVNNNLPGFESKAEYRNATQQAGIALSYSFGSGQNTSRAINKIEETNRMKLD